MVKGNKLGSEAMEERCWVIGEGIARLGELGTGEYDEGGVME